jgi:3-methyladenine DNA glycosylase AlkD
MIEISWVSMSPHQASNVWEKKHISNKPDYHTIIQQMEALRDPEGVTGMVRFGITPARAYGIKIPVLRQMAKAIGPNHALALQLWANDSRETRILASMVDDPKQVTEAQMDQWAQAFDYWEICDQCIQNLFEKTPYAYQKAVEWSGREEEFVKRAGFVLMARLAVGHKLVGDKQAADEKLAAFLPLIEREAADARNNVKKGVSWALRQIGKRNRALHEEAVATAERIQAQESKAARWVASDVLRELESAAVKARF